MTLLREVKETLAKGIDDAFPDSDEEALAWAWMRLGDMTNMFECLLGAVNSGLQEVDELNVAD